MVLIPALIALRPNILRNNHIHPPPRAGARHPRLHQSRTLLTVIALGVVIVDKRKQHRRVEAGTIRVNAAEESPTTLVNVKRSPTRPRPRAGVAQAEADAKAACRGALQIR